MSIFGLNEIDCENDWGKVLSPAIDREIDQREVLAPWNDRKIDQDKDLETDLKFLEKLWKMGQKDKKKKKLNNLEIYSNNRMVGQLFHFQK